MMQILALLKSYLKGRRCFILFSYRITIKITKDRPLKVGALYLENFYKRQVEYLISKFPDLKSVSISPDLFGYKALFNLYIRIIPALGGISAEVHIRNTLYELRDSCEDRLKFEELTNEIARSDLRCGIAERALRLKGSLNSSADLDSQLHLLNDAYGFKIADGTWPYSSRGESLAHFYKNHLNTIKSKKILHLSPEPELRIFFEGLANSGALIYHTSNLFGDDVDYLQDLTEMTFEKESYDLIICHRVLEHILDDEKALSELHRCLKIDGVLSISVPQSLHVEKTLDWVIPDNTHHEHVRQYGLDFRQRLANAGFDVKVNNWLLQIPEHELHLHRIYPLKFYEAVKVLTFKTKGAYE